VRGRTFKDFIGTADDQRAKDLQMLKMAAAGLPDEKPGRHGCRGDGPLVPNAAKEAFADMKERLESMPGRVLTEKQRGWLKRELDSESIEYESPAERNASVPRGKEVAPAYDTNIPKRPPARGSNVPVLSGRNDAEKNTARKIDLPKGGTMLAGDVSLESLFDSYADDPDDLPF
jgi:hypothetical protein